MKLNLTRALKLRKELEARLQHLDLPTSVTFSVLIENDIDRALNNARVLLAAKRADYIRLSVILARTRISITEANVRSGVETVLAELAEIDREVRITTAMLNSPQTPMTQVIEAEIALAKATLVDGMSSHVRKVKDVSFGVVEDTAVWMKAKAALNRRRQALEDKRAGLNASFTIEIPDDDVTFLEEWGVI